MRKLDLATTWILGWVLAGCTPEPASSADGAAPAVEVERPIAPVLTPGEAHTYTLRWDNEAARGREGPGTSLAGGLHLHGELVVTAVGEHEGGTLVAAWLARATRREIELGAETIELDEAALVGPRAYFVVNADGAVNRTYFDPESAPLFRELMTGVIARLDMQGASPSGRARTVKVGPGLVEVVYQRVAGEDAIRRELQRLVRFDAASGLGDAPTVSAWAELTLDADRVPVRLVTESSAGSVGEQLATSEHFSVQRVRVETIAVPRPTDLGHMLAVDPTAPPDLAAAERELARQRAAGLTVQDVRLAVLTMDGGVMPRPGFVSRASALVIGWPEHATDVEALAQSAGPYGRQLVLDVLASAGNAQAQASMLRIVAQGVDESWRELPQLLQRFAFLTAPESTTGQALVDLHAHAVEGEELELCRAVSYPMGSVAARLEHSDPWVSERLHARLVRQLEHDDPQMRAAALGGLGNARRAADTERIVAHLDHRDLGVRIEAVSALRGITSDAARAALRRASADPDEAVADRAADVLRRYHGVETG